MPVCFAKHCMKFTFRGFSGEMPPLLLMSSEPEEHCSRFWSISLNTDAGIHLVKRVEESKVSPRKISSSSSEAAIYLTATRGMGAPEPRICYERVESLCHSLNRPMLLYSALIGQVALFSHTLTS